VSRTHNGRLLLTALGLVIAGCGGSGGGGVVDGGLDASGGVLPTEKSVSMAQVQNAIFTPRCAIPDCHVGTDAPFGLDLSAGEAAGNLIGVDSEEVPEYQRVERFNADDSYLYMKLVDDPRIGGDPMPAFGPPLSATELAFVEDWIDQGAN
jgi:hypothetical protein